MKHLQIETERGLIAINRLYGFREQAKSDGYSYAFSIRKPIKADVYDRAQDALHHDFVLVVTRQPRDSPTKHI